MNNCNKKTEDYFEKYLEQLFHELMVIDSKFELYKSINEHKKDRLRELNIAPGFFNLVLNIIG